MRKVRTCDFCGDDATGLYEPLPPSVPGSPRMLLCDPCRDRLSSVVDPLLAEMEGDVDRDAGGRSDRSIGAGADAPPGTTDAGSRAGGRTGHSGTDDLETREWPDDPREQYDDAGERSADDGGRQSDPRDRSAGAPSGASDASAEPTDVSAEPRDDEVGAAEDLTAEPARDDAGSPPTSIDDLADDHGDDAEVSESRDASGRTQRERGGAPRGYRKVMRFLENRELPMDRSEAESLAAEAYEFDVDEVSEAIDHAVQYGRLREVSGELKR